MHKNSTVELCDEKGHNYAGKEILLFSIAKWLITHIQSRILCKMRA